ncbi:MAG: FCD domain-containing protein, partial [Microvirga sp.]
EARMAAGDRTAAELWKRYDREFHTALVSACGSEVLLETHASIYDKYLRYQMVGDIYRGGVAAREHRDLMRCALRRDFAGAREILARHVQDCVETALATGELKWLEPPARPQARTRRPYKEAARPIGPRPRRVAAGGSKRKARMA